MKYRLLAVIVIFMISSFTAGFATEFPVDRLSENTRSALIESGMWQASCPVNLDDLRVISIKYYDFQGHPHQDGKMILHKDVAQSAYELFDQLYLKKFPFSSIETLDRYKGNIQVAERQNVSYGFICQHNADNSFSPESSGTLMTINPVFNPEVIYTDDRKDQYVEVLPMTGMFSVNRGLKMPGMTESVSALFSQKHFVRLELPRDHIGWKKFVFVNDPLDIQLDHLILPLTTNTQSENPVFTYQSLSPEMISRVKKNGAWREGCPVPLERLSLLTLSYYDFSGQSHTGSLVVFDALAPYLISAFKELYAQHFPLEEFDASSKSDKAKENTSGYNCRNKVGKSTYSLHAFGMAIDVNVSRNPYVGAYKINNNEQTIGSLIPGGADSLSYLNRNQKRPGMNEEIVSVMAKYGLTEWGGNWQDRIDYMHFQVPSGVALHLAELDKQSAEQLIALVIKYPESAKRMSADTRWDYLFKMYPDKFINVLGEYFHLLKTENETRVINQIYRDLAAQRRISMGKPLSLSIEILRCAQDDNCSSRILRLA